MYRYEKNYIHELLYLEAITSIKIIEISPTPNPLDNYYKQEINEIDDNILMVTRLNTKPDYTDYINIENIQDIIEKIPSSYDLSFCNVSLIKSINDNKIDIIIAYEVKR